MDRKGIEEQMSYILSHIMELERQLRMAENIESELKKYRKKLTDLSWEYEQYRELE